MFIFTGIGETGPTGPSGPRGNTGPMGEIGKSLQMQHIALSTVIYSDIVYLIIICKITNYGMYHSMDILLSTRP